MKFDNTKISVIVPTIGRKDVIKCLESISNQSISCFEVILCYDGDDFFSFDKLIKSHRYDNFVKVINVGPFKGGNNARQSGVEISQGNYIALLDDDDEWLPNHLESMINKIEDINYPYNFSFSKPIRCSNGKEVKQFVYFDNSDLLSYICTYKKDMKSFGVIQSSLILVRREILDIVPLDKRLKFHQDTEWLLRLGEQLKTELKIYFSDEHTVKINETLGSVSKNIKSFESRDLFVKTIKNKKFLGNYLLGISYNYAVVQESFFNKLSIFCYAVIYTRPDIRLLSLALIKLIFPWKMIRKILNR